jgi:hypothetical protein
MVELELSTVDVPLLRDGADPGDDPLSARGLIEMLQLDRRLLPPDAESLFAYRPGASALGRVAGAIRPGDLVVLTTRISEPDARGVYAVRHASRVILTRAVRHDHVLMMLPSDRSGRPDVIEMGQPSTLRDYIAGAVVATIRAWPTGPPVEEEPSSPLPRGRSVRLEEGFLVRDCQWHPRYGWRPVQRPEDMDYLEANPGTKIRFRLMKGDEVRFHLEMSPKQWRKALGDYYRGPNWRANGYVVAITHRREGEYTEEFQPRWRKYIRKAKR